MRLPITQALAYLVAISSLARVFASPANKPDIREAVYDSLNLEGRAPKAAPYPEAIELEWVGGAAGSPVYKGIKHRPSLFDRPSSDLATCTAAKQTYEKFMKSQQYPPQSLLVSVMSIPGYGLVAGTIWHGSDEYFEQQLQTTAPKLWTLAQNQGVKLGGRGSKWHAEIVAEWVAESTFPTGKPSSRWPLGTKICSYGLEGGREGYKKACMIGGDSNTRLSCEVISRAQGIALAELPDDCEMI